MSRRTLLCGLLFAAFHCTPAEPARGEPARQSPRAVTAAQPLATVADGIEHTLRPLLTTSGEGMLHRFRIPLALADFDFVDLAYRDPLISKLGARALLFNGGYWAYQGKRRVIEGLVIVDDHPYAPKNGNLTGGVLEVREGRARMIKSADYAAQSGTSLALQCSPRLVVDSRPIPKLDEKRRAARTALCVTGERTRLDVYLTDAGTAPTLAELALFLVKEGCVEALNLDGGPSTAAVAKAAQGQLTVGTGEALPYGIGVTLAQPK